MICTDLGKFVAAISLMPTPPLQRHDSATALDAPQLAVMPTAMQRHV